jgi:hypothetical protein
MYEHRLSLSESEGALVIQACLPRTETAVAYTFLDTRRAKSGGVYTECMERNGDAHAIGTGVCMDVPFISESFSIVIRHSRLRQWTRDQASARWASALAPSRRRRSLVLDLLRQGLKYAPSYDPVSRLRESKTEKQCSSMRDSENMHEKVQGSDQIFGRREA